MSGENEDGRRRRLVHMHLYRLEKLAACKNTERNQSKNVPMPLLVYSFQLPSIFCLCLFLQLLIRTFFDPFCKWDNSFRP